MRRSLRGLKSEDWDSSESHDEQLVAQYRTKVPFYQRGVTPGQAKLLPIGPLVPLSDVFPTQWLPAVEAGLT